MATAGLMVLDAATSNDVRFTAAAGGVALLWLVACAIAALATHPKRAEPMPAGLEPGGPHSPAVASLLVHRWRLPRLAAAATLVDLAARKVLRIDGNPDAGYTFTVQGTDAELNAYERQALDLVRAKGDDAVPFQAITLGDEATASRWWAAFEHRVVAESRSFGLSRRRWSWVALVTIGLTAFAPSALLVAAGLAWSHAHPVPPPPAHHSFRVGVLYFVAAGFAWIPLIALAARSRGERETPAGLDAMGRWLGLAENLRAGAFPDLEPTAVAIWDRYLAYAVGLDVAHRVIATLPVAQDDASTAWSHETGSWRLVHISYQGVGDLAGLFPDVHRSRTIEGVVLRIRRARDKNGHATTTWAAVDDGSTDRIVAWRVSPVPDGLQEGCRARVTFRSPRRPARAVDVLQAPPATVAPAAADSGPTAMRPRSAAIDATWLSDVLGEAVQLKPGKLAAVQAVARHQQSWVGDRTRLTVREHALGADLDGEFDRFADEHSTLGVGFTPIFELGDEARRYHPGGVVLARKGHRAVAVRLHSKLLAHDEANAATEAIARQALEGQMPRNANTASTRR